MNLSPIALLIALSVVAAPIGTDTIVVAALIVAALCLILFITPRLPQLAQYVVYGLIVLVALIWVAIKLGIVG